MTLTVHNLTTGHGFTHSGVTQREVAKVITALSENRMAEHRIVVTVGK